MLFHDRTGLAMMFVMPLFLVCIITIIQDSAFRVVNENKISLLIVNSDSGEYGTQLVEKLRESKFFTATINNNLDSNSIKQVMTDDDHLTSLFIPANFSDKLIQKSQVVSGIIMRELGLKETDDSDPKIAMPPLKFYHDPVLQENFSASIVNIFDGYVSAIEGDLLITQICLQLDLKEAPKQLRVAMTENKINIEKISATLSNSDLIPNSTQHNVPAWTIFAMFFMVVSLGGNIVKERINGSFVRLTVMPTSFSLVLGAKLFVYLSAVILQVILIFSMAKLIFPYIGLPHLTMPSSMFIFALVVLISGIAAVSFATVIGTLSQTVEQANGFGAVSVVILAAVGGIWVPSFIMPEYMKILSYCSPMYWSLESFYTLFLRGGDLGIIAPKLAGLLIFSLVCFMITYLQLKKSRII